MANIKLFNIDCFKFMADKPDNYYNAIITDPPYNIGDENKLCKQGNKIKTNKEMWGNFEPKDEKKWYEFLKKCFIEFYRICLGSIIIFYDRFEITKIKDMLQDVGYYPKNILCIIKNNPLPHFRKNGFRSSFELAIYCQKEKGKDTFNFLSQKEMQGIDNYTIGNKDTDHPTEKPLKIIAKYVKIITNENDLIFDPFMGSGTTALACEKLNRNFEGCEIDKKYYEIAKKRYDNHIKQLRMF